MWQMDGPSLGQQQAAQAGNPYRHDIGTILVKQREGLEKEELTLPWIMKHLKPLKAAGPYED